MTKWTPEEIKLLASNLSDAEISKRTGKSEPAIRGKRQRLAKVDVHEPSTLEEDKARTGADYWRKQYQALERKYQRTLNDASAVDQLVQMAVDLAPKSYDPRPQVPSLSAGKGSAQSAVLLLSDTHVGKVVEPNQTLGFGLYNFQVFLARLKFYEEAVVSILRDHTTTPVPELVIAIGGDMLDGALNHGAEAGQKMTLFSQFYGAGHAIAQFIRNLACKVPKIRIYGTVGNHTRWGTQRKMPTDNRYSNLDQFLMAYTEALTTSIKNVEWNLTAQPFALFEVQKFLFHLSHGDHLRGGDRALGIPNHAVGRMVSSTSQLFGKRNESAPHYYLTGHLHRGIVLPHGRGSVIVNGGFPGVDGFGLAEGFSAVDPSQVFFFVHPKFGKTATYEIKLQHAPVMATPPYCIPDVFPL